MRKYSLFTIAIGLTLLLQACKADPSGPGEPVMMASIYDTSLYVDVSGTWKMISEPAGNVMLSISSPAIQCRVEGALKYVGLIDAKFNRSIVTKRNGMERIGTMYGVRINGDQWWNIAVATRDSLYFGPCDREIPDVTGLYIRVK